MAVRPVFAADLYGRLCKRVNVEFALYEVWRSLRK